MVLFADWVVRYPQFQNLSEDVFNLFQGDAVTEMGELESRWYGMYDIAMSALIAHNVARFASYEVGDHTPLQPIRTKEVDDVMVEYAVSREMQNNLDPYLSTTYGQQYVKYRRMAFAGPRVP